MHFISFRRFHHSGLIIVLAAIALILLAGFIAILQVARRVQSVGFVLINNHSITIDTFDTPALRTKGLSGRTSLPSDKGALFVYDQPGIQSIWMKDMHFPIDVLWLDGDGSVIYLVDDMSPESYPMAYQSDQPAAYVLELHEGAIAHYGIRIGSQIDNLPAGK